MTDPLPATLRLRDVTVRRDGRTVLDVGHWEVTRGQHWVVMGTNGSGKSTLLQVAGLTLHPTTGSVEVLGETLGRTDVRTLRTRIGVSSAALGNQLRPGLRVLDVVMTARHGALEPWWHPYTDDDRARAAALLDRLGCGDLAERELVTASSGERQRVLLARALMTDPGLVLLDEPTAALDLAGREQLLVNLDGLAADPDQAPTVLVTHHVEEIPPRFTHALLLRDGEVTASGPIDEVIDEDHLGAAFGLDVALSRHAGRWAARAR